MFAADRARQAGSARIARTICNVIMRVIGRGRGSTNLRDSQKRLAGSDRACGGIAKTPASWATLTARSIASLSRRPDRDRPDVVANPALK